MECLLKPREAAQVLGIKLSTLYTWVYRRQIPSQRVCGALRFSPTALSNWLTQQARPALAELVDDKARGR